MGVFFGLFILLGMWQILLVPFFQGPDEQVHYATIQFWAEPKEKTWLREKDTDFFQNDDIRYWNFSEEVREAGYRLEFDHIKWQSENTPSFTPHSPYGPHEELITHNEWGRVITTIPENTSGTWSLYYLLGEKIETFFSNYSLFNRLFLLRAFSLSISLGTLLIAYLAARALGWAKTTALTFTALIAFQPMFLATSAIINLDILLFFAFSLFSLGAIRWLSDGPSISRFLILITAALIGIFTKGPGIVLIGLSGLLIGYSLYQRYQSIYRERFFAGALITVLIIANILALITPPEILTNFLYFGKESSFSSPTESIASYLDETMSWSAFERTSLSYWGNFGWLDAAVPDFMLQVILAIEILALFGLMWLFLDQNPPRFLPNKRILLFAFVSIIALQLAIRFFDWRVFDATGKILIGTPGRYFLPNILPHILLVVSGLGYWLGTKECFQSLLRLLALLMFLLTLYCSWFIILPRYYL